VNARHDPTLIVIALAIAVLASHVALDFAGRVRRARRRTRALWWLGGAMGVIVGIGIWSLHFVATLALEAPSRTVYDAPVVLLTVFVAIVASAVALHVRSRQVLPVYALVIASLLMSAAISGMQYAQGVSMAVIPGTLLILGLALTIAAIDARERLLAREQRVRYDAETTNRLKDEFLATLSHELRTPLNVILGRTQMLHNAAHDEARVHALTETIERNGTALAKLVDDLLDVSRITLGHVRLETQTVRLADLLTIAAQGIQPSAQAKDVALTVNTTDAGTVTGDPTRLQQVIWNLLTNAIKFTPQHGRVEARMSREGARIVLRVSDTGCGINPAFLPHVFEPFRQAESTVSRMHGGLGIGLSIVRHLIELHDGTITAQSAGTGQGSVFVISLPAARDEQLALNAAPATASSG
jgi:signal transduction histidine kinase